MTKFGMDTATRNWNKNH